MAFTRKFLTEHGVPEEQIDAIMAERNRTLSDYVPKDDVQKQVEAALAEAAKNTPPADVTQSPEYIELLNKAQKLEAFQGDEFASVKAPYRDIVWGKLDHAEKHKPYQEQLTELQSSMPDLFKTTEEPPKPQFGAQPQGAAPTGQKGPSFNDVWGFGPKQA